MRAAHSSAGWRILFLGVLIALGSWAIGARAVDPDEQPKKGATVEPAKPAEKKPPEKMISFEMRDKPWGQVLEWFSDQSSLPFIGNIKPTGTFTFIAPRGAPKQYTIPQIIDILNEALLNQKYVLIRRTASFTLMPADEKIDPAILPRIAIEDLEQRGNTELVSVVLPLTSLVAEDVAPEVKKMMGPFGDVVAMAKANQLVMQDTAGNLKRVYKTIKDIENNEKGQAESFSHTCKYIKARDAEKILRELLGDPRELLRATQPQPSSPFDRGPRPAPVPAAAVGKIRMHYISADERTNSVLVNGPADKIAQAREIMKRLDVTQQGQAPVLVGPPILKTYPVPAGNAEAMAKTLQDVYKASGTIRISAVGNSSLMVWAGPDDQFEIARHILGSTESNSATELMPLQTLDAARTVDTLKGMFGDHKTGAPYVEADVTRNALIVKGSREQVADVRAALKALGEGGGGAAGGGNMRIITLGQGSATTLAEALERLLPQMRKNPVRVIRPGGESRPPEPPRKEEKDKTKTEEKDKTKTEEKDKTKTEEKDKTRTGKADERLNEVVVDARADGKQLTDPQEKKAPPSDKPGRADAPVTITAFGNRLIVTSDDPQALALVQELVRLLTHTPGGEGDFEVVKLKNANATEAAKILDEAFNGTRRQSDGQSSERGGGFSSFFSRLGGGQQAPAAPPNPSANRIRVVADPATNSLLIRASPLDLLTIRRLLDKAIDASDTDSRAVTRTWVVGPLKFATAHEVANVLRDVYREYMNNNPQATSLAGIVATGLSSRSPFGGGLQNMNLDANGRPRAVSLSVGVDDRSNSLVLSCSEALYKELKKLVDQLELAAKDSTRTVKVISIKGVDPLLVQQAIDAIQGRRSNFRTGTMQGNGNGNGTTPGFVPFGTGGFVPGSTSPTLPGTGFTPGRTPRGNGPPGSGQLPAPGDGRGPDFFVERVKDDPQPTVLYDPHPESDGEETQPVSLEASEEQEEQQPAPSPSSGDIRGPRSPVTAEALEQLGVIVISGNNPTDVEEIVRIIDYIQKLGAGSEVRIQLVPLDHADATSVAHTLSQLFQQVIIGPTGNVARPLTGTAGQAQPQQAQPGAPPQQAQPGREQASSVVLLPLPRLNAILMAAPQARVEDVIKEIKRLDRPTPPQGQTTAFPLRKASAARVATLVQQFYAQRYPNETSAQHQIRVTFDDSTNTIFVQAAPADLAEISGLIERIDSTVSSAISDLRIVPLRNALAEELAALLIQAIAQGFVPAVTTAPGIVPTGAGAAAGARPPGAAGAGPAGVPQAGGGGVGQPGQGGLPNKSMTLRFVSPGRIPGALETGLLEDIHITPDARTNSLILAAPAKTVELLLALVRELDVPPAARAEVKIFPLKKGDAAATAILLQQLFLGTGGQAGAVGGTGGGAGGAGGAGGGGGPGGVGGAGGLSGSTATFTGAAGIPRPLLVLGGTPPEGAPLVDLRLTIDQRTNSVIVAGTAHDVDIIEAIISRLEDADVQPRHNEVYRLKNAAAADVAAALQSFITRSLQVLAQGQQLTAFQEIARDVVVVPEPVTNSLLISATPEYFADILRLIKDIDAESPQVVIQVLVAEVDLDDSNEFGMEIGMQSPVLFQRSIFPSFPFLGTSGVINYTNPGLVPQGVTVNNSINPAALPGFNFNNSQFFSAPLGNNPVVSPQTVGFQGLTNLGVGRSSPSGSGLGGFVFSAGSDSFNLLIRALRTQNRMDILSRPQVMTLDNQAARILVGQSFPYSGGTTATATGVIINNVLYRNIGVELDVTPRISCDNKVLMRVTPQISSPVTSTINLGNGVNATIFNVQTVDTTVVCQDGETVAIGGLIQKQEVKTENKVPWLGDLPCIGTLFRYRSQTIKKTELLVILTPHVVRTPMEADRILAEESRRIDWVLSDVNHLHATTGMEPVFGPHAPPGDGVGPMVPSSSGEPPPGPPLAPPLAPTEARPEVLPQPRVVPAAPTTGRDTLPDALPTGTTPGTPWQAPSQGPALPAGDDRINPVPEKETRGWNPFRRN